MLSRPNCSLHLTFSLEGSKMDPELIETMKKLRPDNSEALNRKLDSLNRIKLMKDYAKDVK